MHAAGLHSALAIKRQRKRRDEQRRAKERRYSLQSTESGLTGSQGSLDRTGSARSRAPRKRRNQPDMLDTKVVSSIGMLHIGVVFLVLGIFLVGSGLLPDDITSWSALGHIGWWNELVCTGLFALGIGIFLIILNKYISRREDDDLEFYVQSQLTRSRSGHRLERDVETGGMLTKHHRRERQLQKEGEDKGLGSVGSFSNESPPPMSPRSPPAVSTGPTHHGFINPVSLGAEDHSEHHHHHSEHHHHSIDPEIDHLDRIDEEYSASEKGEEEMRRMEIYNKESYTKGIHLTSTGVAPDATDLISNGRHLIMSRM